MFSSAPRAMPVRNLCLIVLVVCGAFQSSSFAQQPVLTSRADSSRTGANTNETLLTPTNVSKNSFGRLFSFPVDYVVMAQPLYVPNVTIPGHGTHNVIYTVTQADSVYAIDADNGAQLWYASMLNVGGTTASGIYLPCSGPGYDHNQEGIVQIRQDKTTFFERDFSVIGPLPHVVGRFMRNHANLCTGRQ